MKGWRLFTLLFSLCLTAFTLVLALDTFVIPRVYAAVPASGAEASAPGAEELPASAAGEAAADAASEGGADASGGASEALSPEPVSTETTYDDGEIRISVSEYRVHDTTVYVADVTLSDASALQTAFAQNVYGKNVTAKTSETAASVNAVLAVNGDYYGARETGYVIRGGVLYRDEAAEDGEDLVIWEDGSFGIIREAEVTAQELLAMGARDVLSFGPALVTDGRIAVTEDEEVGRAMAENPRTAIAEMGALHYLFVVSDGRTEESSGLTLYELAEFLQSLGATTAYNLDGGGSSTMVFQGRVVNNPTTSGDRIRERSVSDIVYVGV